MLALLLVAVSLGLSNFAAAIGLGVAGINSRTRLRVGIVFGIFETCMPLLGLLAGRGLAQALGHAAHWIGAGLLVATGMYAVIQALWSPHGKGQHGTPGPASQGTRRLLITGAALSIDNLAVGFALGTYHVGLPVAVLVIGAISVTMSLLGLELGHRLDTWAGRQGELLGGLVLIGVGAAIAAGAI
jgi:manganese efflux pump family protein